MEMLTRIRLWLTIGATLLIVACSPKNDYTSDRTPIMDKPSPRIEKLFAQTKPVCFGRFIIDVPATTKVVWGPTDVNDTIVSYPGQGHKIPAQIRDKVKELQEEKHIREPSTYIGTFDGPNPDSKIVVGYEDFESSGTVQLNSYIRLGTLAFVQSAPSAALGRDSAGVINKTGYQRFVAEMQDIGQRLRLRDESEIPSEPGVCIEAGFASEANGRYYELTSIGFRFPEYPDVSFSVMTHTTTRPNPDNSLEVALEGGRRNAEDAGMGSWYRRIKTLREGKRVMGDWEGFEKLARLPAHKEGSPSVHEFAFKSIGVAKDMFRPYVNMQMDTGVDGDSTVGFEPSLKDDEAVTLWDKLTKSIRARPTGGPATSAAEPEPDKPAPAPQSQVPLGTRLASGTRCPQSGTWVCDRPDALGGTRRFITEGETLSSVLVPVERSFFQKLKGNPQSRLAGTTWTLESLSDGSLS